MRRASVATALAVLMSACAQGSQSQPPAPPATAPITLAPLAAPPACPSPRAPTYLPWGVSIGFTKTAGTISVLRSDAPPSSFVLERRADTVGAPTSVTAAPRVIYGRETYLLWSGAPGASEISAWWEEGTGSCHTYHARLTLAADAAEVESQFVKVIGSIPAAFVDESAGKTGLLAEIALEHAPTAVAVMPFADRLFVADREGGLSAFATSTNAFVRWTDLHLTDVRSVARLAVVPFTKRVYALDQAGDRVLVIDGETLDVIATIPVGQAPTAIAADQKANLIYVANFGRQSGGPDERPGSISVIDGTTDKVVAVVPTQGHPMAVDVAGDRVYAGALELNPSGSGFIQVINARTRTEIASVGTSPPWLILADPVDGAVYALSNRVLPSSTTRKIIGSIWIELDMRTLGAAGFVDGPGDARAIGWHAGSDIGYRRVYVATQRDIGGVLTFYGPPTAGSTRLRRLSVELRVGDSPVGIAVDSASHRVYVASNGDKIVSVILQAR